MRRLNFCLGLALLCSATAGTAELAEKNLIEHKVDVSDVTYLGRASVRAVPAIQSADEDKIAILTDSHFSDGSVEGYISGNLLPSAGAQARGFVGIAFRIDQSVSSFEAVYLRPTNARAEDQLRRNHSVQYISYPDFPWHRLRRETPAKYETYADMAPGQWIHFRLDVQGQSARLYLNNSEQPVLIINDLKHGVGSGRVGLWVGPGTEAHFSDIIINSTPRTTAPAD